MTSDINQSNEDPPRDAIDWRVRLESEQATEVDWLAFEDWLCAAPENLAAYERVEALELELTRTAAHWPIAPSPLPAPSSARLRPVWLIVAGAAAAAAAASIAVFAAVQLQPLGGRPAVVYATLKGQRRTIVFNDNTRIDLNSDTTLSASMLSTRRQLQLIKGEVFIAATHSAARPLSLDVDRHQINDIGTRFDVSKVGANLQVSVFQGAVAVRQIAQAISQKPVVVSKGFRFEHTDGEGGSTLSKMDAGEDPVWLNGRAIYRDQRLDVVVADLNRYFSTPIRVEDERAAKLRFTGVLVLDSEAGVVRRLQSFLPVVAHHTGGVIALALR